MIESSAENVGVIWSDLGVHIQILLLTTVAFQLSYDPSSCIDFCPLEKQTAGEAASQVYD